MLNIGRVLKTQGNKGGLKVELDPEFPEAPFFSRVFLKLKGEPAPYEVEELRPFKQFYILKLRGVEGMDAARALAGADIFVPEDELRPLAEDMFYEGQLRGCRVVTVGGAEVGVVEDILSAGGSDLLVVRSREEKEILIPFSREICREVDVASQRIVVDPPDGLLDLNEI